MRASIFALAACTGFLATAAYAGTPDFQRYSDQPAIPSQITLAKNAPNQVICESVTHQGAVVRQPVCMTRRAWDVARQQIAEDIREIQMKGDLQ